MPQATQPCWSFTPFRPGVRARESQVEKFFKSDATDRVKSVVREGIQNSLDAAEQDVINVRICLGHTTAAEIAPYAQNLFGHLGAEGVRKKLNDIPQPDEDVTFLSFEDFNTSGLGGDPNQWAPDPDAHNPFFNFFRGEGVSDKVESKRGRHGVGKMVFTVASRAHCMFAVTSTQDNPPLLMGTSTLALHERDGSQYHPDGWYGVLTPANADEIDKYVAPVTDPGQIEKFCTTFSLDRETLPGVSIVVPWLDQAFDRATLIHAVVDGYFWPILKGGLTVEIIADGQTTMVDAKTIVEIAEELTEDREAVLANLALAQWAIQLPASDIPASEPPQANGAQTWLPNLIPEQLLEQLQTKQEADENFALKVPLHIRRKSEQPQQTCFHIYTARDDTCAEGSICFIRDGLIIFGVRSGRTRRQRSLVVIEQGPLATFLGDAENPAHTEWLKQNVREGYTYHASCINFVVQSVPTVLRYLSGQQKKSDPTLLLDLFYVPSPQAAAQPAKANKPKKKGAGESDKPNLDDLPKRPKKFQLQKRATGFVIGKGDDDAERPQVLDIRTAYGVRRGSPFKKYNTADFCIDKSPIDIDLDGATIIHSEGNRLKVEILDDDFRIQVAGFDTNRDLFIDTRAIDPEPDEDAPTN